MARIREGIAATAAKHTAALSQGGGGHAKKQGINKMMGR